ncbi:MAG: sensor histidine kinase [Spirulina sp. DLM2.Bin59]|nr:MAG: sensor histidine kinase [Spirulina sp. DLM2.Bin59]
MSLVFMFLLGLLVGLAFCGWQHYQFRQQLERLLRKLPAQFQDPSVLNPLYRLRRSMEALLETQYISQQQGQMWTVILEVAPLGYLRVDALNQLLWCNPVAREILQINRWQSGQVRLLLELVRSYELDQLIEATRRTGQPQQLDWVYRSTTIAREETAIPSPYAIALRASTLLLPDDHVGVFVENRQPIVEARQARDRAFSDLTHELRTPLTSIQLVAETLLPRLQNPEKKWVTQMLREIKRLIGLIQSCLDLSRLSSQGGEILNPHAIPFASLVQITWQTLEPLADRKQIRLRYHDPENVEIWVDRDRFMQVLLNLLDNAIKHSPEGAEISVKVGTMVHKTAQGPKNWHTIDIIDHGLGFREAELPLIFERLYRGDASRQRSGYDGLDSSLPNQGSGLGLAIVQQIVAAHGGKITAQNHPETGGAWLNIQLPTFTQS